MTRVTVICLTEGRTTRFLSEPVSFCAVIDSNRPLLTDSADGGGPAGGRGRRSGEGEADEEAAEDSDGGVADAPAAMPVV